MSEKCVEVERVDWLELSMCLLPIGAAVVFFLIALLSTSPKMTSFARVWFGFASGGLFCLGIWYLVCDYERRVVRHPIVECDE